MIVDAILQFWFGSVDDPTFGQQRDYWFRKDPEFDRTLADNFGLVYERAARGEFAPWEQAPQSCLALTIVLDQFPRNLFRNSSQAFATDAQALAVARSAIDRGFDRELLPVQRWFFYLPFEHSESLTDQETCLRLWEDLRDDPASAGAIEFARRHWEVVARFGRFPHRNEVLGRSSSPEELAFLAQPGSRF
ncbi:MAG: DUF924 domain-containing protein [Oscillatoriales cyanobacterium]|nr:MAG: DUF924 domain-containing protein [Oscillatoriales cyanobacterium]